MPKRGIILLFLFLIIAACGNEEGTWGTANLKITNNSSRYVDGTIKAEKLYGFSVKAKSNVAYGIPVGSGVIGYTWVLITANVHETSSASSPVAASYTKKIRMSPNYSYEYVIPFSGAADFEPRIMEHGPSKRSITGP
jgi:hypothetical protein